jgi:hypothetical protein
MNLVEMGGLIALLSKESCQWQILHWRQLLMKMIDVFIMYAYAMKIATLHIIN